MPGEKHECTIKFEWQNEVDFKVTQKMDGEDTILIKIEENGCIGRLWGTVTEFMSQYQSQLMHKIGVEMKKEAVVE